MKNRHFRSIGALLIVVAMLVGMIGTTGVVFADDSTYTVTYDKNATTATGGVPTDTKTYKANESVTVLGKNTLANSGYEFQGWANTTDGAVSYREGDTFNIGSADVTLYAVWKQIVDTGVARTAVDLHKFVVADPSILLPAKEFSYTIAPLGVGDATNTADMPTLTISKKSSTTSGQSTSTTGEYYRNGLHANTVEAGTALSLDFEYKNTENLDISTTDGIKWPHAGVYRYYITEKTVDNDGDWTYMTDMTTGTPTNIAKTGKDQTKQNGYEILVYVVNGTSGLETKYVEVDSAVGTTNNGVITLTEVAKVDATKGSNTNTDGSSLEFTNTYDPKINLTISKEVTGNAADYTKVFDFTITELKIPSGTDSSTSVLTGAGYTATNKVNTVTKTTISNTLTDIHEGSTFKLGKDDSFTIKDIPVGTTFTITETKNTNYTASYQVTEKGVELTKTTGTVNADSVASGTVKLDETITSTAGKEEDNQNKVAYTNRYEVSTPTGIILSNLPAFAAIFCALGLAVFALIARRKRSR